MKKKYFMWIVYLLMLVVTIGSAMATVSQDDLLDGLVIYYKLDASSGAVIDSHGSNNGANYGATRNVDGKINKGFSFDGSNDYLNTGATFRPSAFTFSFWSKKDSTNSKTWISTRNNNDDGFELGNSQSNFFFRMENLNTMVSSGNNLSIDTWQHVVFTWDGSTRKIYLNGEELASGSYSTALTTGGTLDIGRREYAASYLDGDMDEVAIYNRALNSTEVSTLYDIQKDGYTNGTYNFSALSGGGEPEPDPEPDPEYFTITAKDVKETTSISSFSVNVTYNDTTTSYSTTNGSVITNIEYVIDTANLTFYGLNNKYIEQTVNDISTNSSYEGSINTKPLITLKDVKEDTSISSFNLTISSTTYDGTSGSVYVPITGSTNIDVKDINAKYLTPTITETLTINTDHELDINTKPLIKVYDVENNLLSNYNLTINGTVYEVSGDSYYYDGGNLFTNPNNYGIILPFNNTLIWEKEVNSNTNLNYADSVAYCDSLSLGNLDWRVPNSYEMFGEPDYEDVGSGNQNYIEGSLLHWMNTERGYPLSGYSYPPDYRDYGDWLNTNWGFSGFTNKAYRTSTHPIVTIPYEHSTYIVLFNTGEVTYTLLTTSSDRGVVCVSDFDETIINTTIDFDKNSWFTKEFEESLFINEEHNLTDVYESVIDFDISNIVSGVDLSANITINGVTKEQDETWYLLEDEYTALIESTSYYSKNVTFDTTALTTETISVELHDSLFTVDIISAWNNNSITPFTLEIYQHTYDYYESFSITNNETIELKKNLTYELCFSLDDQYVYTGTDCVNITIENTTQNYTHSLRTNSLYLIFSDLTTGWLIHSDSDVGWSYYGEQQEYISLPSYISFEDATEVLVLQRDLGLGKVYVRFNSLNYTNHTQYFEYDNDKQTLVYAELGLLNTSHALKDTWIKLLNEDGEPIKDATIKLIQNPINSGNNTGELISQRITDSLGMTYLIFNEDTELNIIISAEGYSSVILQQNALDLNSGTYDNPLIVNMRYSSGVYFNNIWLTGDKYYYNSSANQYVRFHSLTSSQSFTWSTSQTNRNFTTTWLANGLYELTLIPGTHFTSGTTDPIIITVWSDGETYTHTMTDWYSSTSYVEKTDLFKLRNLNPVLLGITLIFLSLILGLLFQGDTGYNTFAIGSVVAMTINPIFIVVVFPFGISIAIKMLRKLWSDE